MAAAGFLAMGGHKILLDFVPTVLGHVGSGIYWIVWGRSEAQTEAAEKEQQLRTLIREESGKSAHDLGLTVQQLEKKVELLERSLVLARSRN